MTTTTPSGLEPNPGRPGRAYRIAAVLGVMLLALGFLVSNGRTIASLDSLPYQYLPIELLHYHTFRLSDYPQLAARGNYSVVRDKEGYLISKKPVFPALLELPGYLVYRLVVGMWPPKFTHLMLLGKLTMCMVAAATAGALTLLLLLWGGLTRRWLAPAAGLGLVVLTPFWFSAMDCWPHPVLAFANVCSLWLLFHRKKEWAWGLIGLLQGVAIATRLAAVSVTVVFLAASLMAGEERWREKQWRPVAFFVGAFFPLLLLGWYNAAYFGSPFATGFGNQAASRIQLPFEGLAGFFFAPAKGLLFFSPVLALVYLGFKGGLWRRLEVKVAALAILIHMLYWSCYSDWLGGWCYGPRYLSEIMPLAVFLATLGLDQALSQSRRKRLLGAVAGSLAVLSLAIQLIGLFGWDAAYYRHYDNGFQGHGRLWVWRALPEPLWILRHGQFYAPKHIP